MISKLPVIQLPNSITQICEMELKNSRQVHSDIALIIEKDKFLSLLFKKSFEEFETTSGLTKILSSYGWEGIRNRIAEAYLYYSKVGHFPNNLDLNEVLSVLKFEKEYDFLFPEGNSRVFMLGLYLKLCEIDLENQDMFEDRGLTEVPLEVKKILSLGKSKSQSPDWLIIIVWSFYLRHGKPKCLDLFKTQKGSVDEIINVLSKNEYGQFIMDLLIYGHSINDVTFFTEEKV